MNISLTSDKIFPVTIGSVALIGCFVLLIRMMPAPEGDALFADQEQGDEDGNAPYGLWPTLAWFGFLLVLSALFGFVIALSVFFLTFLRMRARVSWMQTINMINPDASARH